MQVDSLPAEPPGKPKNTGMGSLSPFQWFFLTQELNWGLLHCRWILVKAMVFPVVMYGCESWTIRKAEH